MDLRAYLTRHDISISAFAGAIGVSVQAVHRYVSGDRIPRPEVMERIVAATEGAVRPNDFYSVGDQNEAERNTTQAA